MNQLAILDFTKLRVIILSVSDKQYNKFCEVYDSNTEDWLCGEGLEDKLDIDISNIQYMWSSKFIHTEWELHA